MKNSLKIKTFNATIESILLYSSEFWTFDSTMRKQIEYCYNRLHRMSTHISWQDKFTNIQLYMIMPKITEVIQQRRL